MILIIIHPPIEEQENVLIEIILPYASSTSLDAFIHP